MPVRSNSSAGAAAGDLVVVTIPLGRYWDGFPL